MAPALQLRRAHIIAAALAAIIIAPAGYIAYCMATLPENGGLVIEPTPSALIVEAADGEVFAARGVFKGDKLSAQDIPANLSHAIIAIEDRHFYEHGGCAISRQQADEARRQPVTLRVPPESPPGTNYFVDMLGGDAKRLVGSASTDLTVRSTLDLDLQNVAENVIARRLKAEGRAKRVGQAALLAMAPDGAILAIVGGRDYNESQFNRATQAKRQPGSLFKVFVYLTAFQKGLDPQATAVDRPVQIGNWEPENYSGRFRGVVTLRNAFAHSINSVAVQLADAIGIQSVIDTARKLGMQSELPAVPSLALGAGEVTLLEMTRAFAAIAADAESVEPYDIRAARNGDRVLYSRQKAKLQPATIQPPARRCTMYSQASCARARLGERGSTFPPRARPGRARGTRMHGSSDSPTTSSSASGLATTTTARQGA